MSLYSRKNSKKKYLKKKELNDQIVFNQILLHYWYKDRLANIINQYNNY